MGEDDKKKSKGDDKKSKKKEEMNCYKTIGPGSNKYKLPPVIGAIHKKEKHDFTRYQYPAYSIQPRRPPLGKPNPVGPGPISEYRTINPPKYSIKSRHFIKTKLNNAQMINFEDKLRPPIYTIHKRIPPLAGFKTPAPNRYMLPSTLNIKHYTLKGKYPTKLKERPNLYDPVDLNIYKNRTPKYSIRPRISGPKKVPGPGPSGVPLCQCNKNRGFVFGIRTCAKPYVTKEDDMPCQDVEYY